MNEFVEECRREWKRLHVPDPVADEMAADLQVDLEEAAADGLAPEEVLGTAAFDPRSFAAAWATERGVTPPPELDEAGATSPRGLRSRTGLIVAVAGIGLIVVVALAGVALAMHPFGSSAETAIVSPARGARLLVPGGPNVRLFATQARRDGLRDAVAAGGLAIALVGIVATVLAILYFSPWRGGPEPRRSPDQTFR